MVRVHMSCITAACLDTEGSVAMLGRQLGLCLTTVLIAGAAIAPPASASEPPALPLAVGEVVAAGPAIKRAVSPKRRFRITIPKVGTLTGPRGAVSSRATLIIRPYRASLSDGVSAAGLGVDVVLRGAKLKKRL